MMQEQATMVDPAKVTTLSLWWKPATGSLTKVVKLTDPTVGVSGGAFKAFTSLALSGGTYSTPIFSASLVSKDTGIWALDSSGALIKIVATTTDTIDTKKITKLNALGTVKGSTGVTRNFNDNRQVVYTATLEDGTQRVVKALIP